MVKKSEILESNEDLIAQSIEQPSNINNEKIIISNVVKQIKDLFPDGVSAYEILEEIPEDIPYSTQLKILIQLANHQLLNLGVTNYKIKPDEVLKIYANPKNIKTDFNLNEINLVNKLTPNEIKELYSNLYKNSNMNDDKQFNDWIKIFDKISTYTNGPKINWWEHLTKEGWKKLHIDLVNFKKKHNISLNESIRITKLNKNFLEEGWKENIIALATAAAGLVGSAKSQDVLRKYNIPQQTQIQSLPNDTLRLNFSTTFKSGRYTFSKENINQLIEKFQQISQFIIKHPNTNFKINVIASESKVPNYDLEKTSSTFKQRLKDGELANKRAEAIKIALLTFESNLRKEGLNFGKININPPKTLIGGPEWSPGEKAADPKYTEHQYVKIEIITEDVNQNNFDFSAFSTDVESMFDANKHIIARVFKRTREANNIEKSGNVDAGHEDVLIRFVNGNTGKFIGEDYLLSSSWWNTNKGTDTQMSPELIKKIRQNGKKV